MASTTSPGTATKFLVPDVILGVGVLSQVGQAVKGQGGIRVFVVSDHGVADAGWTSDVISR